MSNDLKKRSKWRIVEMYSMIFNVISFPFIGIWGLYNIVTLSNLIQGLVGWFLLLSFIILMVMAYSLLLWSFLTPIRHYWTHSETQDDISSREFSIATNISLLMLYLIVIQYILF